MCPHINLIAIQENWTFPIGPSEEAQRIQCHFQFWRRPDKHGIHWFVDSVQTECELQNVSFLKKRIIYSDY